MSGYDITGTHTNGIALSSGTQNPATIAGSAYVTNTAGDAVLGYGYVWTISNYGTINATYPGADGVQLEDGGLVTNVATIDGSGDGIAIAGRAARGTVVNSGVIVGSLIAGVQLLGGGLTNAAGGSIAGAEGVYGEGQAVTVSNSGIIAGSEGAGVFLEAGGTVVDAGTITGASGTAVYLGGAGSDRLVLDPGYGLGGAVVVQGGGNTLELGSAAAAGTLTGLGTNFSNFATVAVDAGAEWTMSGNNTIGGGVSLVDTGTLTNAGTLVGAGYLIVDPGSLVNSGYVSGTVTLAGDSYLDNTATGTITAVGNAVYGTTSPNTVVNAGTISGGSVGVDLTAGGTIVNLGTIDGAANPAVVLKGTAPETVSNSGLISGSIGVYIESADGGANTLVESGTIVGASGTAVSFAGTGSNRLVLDPGYKLVGAAVGSTSAGATDTLELGFAASAGTLTGLGTSFQNFGTVTVDADAQWTLAGYNLVGSGVSLNNAGALTDTGTLVNAGSLYVSGTGDLVVDPGTFVNSGYVYGTATLAGGSYLDNAATGTIVAAGAAVLGMTSPNTVINYGAISAGQVGVYLVAGGYIANDAGGTISGASDGVIFGGDGNVGNSGTIVATQGGADGILLTSGGTVTNASGGVISAVDNGVLIEHQAGAVDNAGTIAGMSGTGLYFAKGGSITNALSSLVSGDDGVVIAGASGAVTNSGTIVGTSGNGVSMSGGVLTNSAGGLVIGALYGAEIGPQAATVVNAGTIASSDRDGSGLRLTGGGSIDNTGLIAGSRQGLVLDIAADVTNRGSIIGAAGIDIEGGGSLDNLGLILGTAGPAMAMEAAGTVTNYGTIVASGNGTDAADLGDATLFDNMSGGFVSGAHYGVSLGGTVTNSGTILGGDNAVIMRAAIEVVINFGVISSTYATVGGAVYLVGGALTNAQTGLVAGYSYGIAIGQTSGTIDNLGTIVGIGNDAAAVELDGGRLVNSGGGMLAGGRDGADLGAPGTVGNAGTIIGSGGYGLRLFQGGDIDNTGSIVGDDIGVYSDAAATVTNDGLIVGYTGIENNGPGLIVNSGTIVGSGRNGIYSFGGSVTNAATGLVSGYGVGVGIGYASGAILNLGTIESTWSSGAGVALNAGGTLTNRGAIIAAGTAFPTGAYVASGGLVDNFGTVTAPDGSDGVAINLARGGTLVNEAAGYLQASSVAVVIQGGGSGSIANYGTITGGGDGVDVKATSDAVFNSGVISGAGLAGVYLYAGGNVTNSTTGLIQGYDGVLGSHSAATAINLGTIVGTGDNGVGVEFLAPGSTLTNVGTIAVDTDAAVQFYNTGDRLIVAPGAVFSGIVNGGAGLGNTLELATGAGAGTLTGLGVSFENFATVTVDGGAQWTFAGANSIGDGATLTDQGTLTNVGTLDITGNLIVDPGTMINSSYVSGTVTLAGGSYLDNTATGTIVAAGTAVYGTTSPNTVANAGMISAAVFGVDLMAGGYVTNAAGGSLYGGAGGVVFDAYGSVNNSGAILGSTEDGGNAVNLSAGGSVTNALGAVIQAYNGIYIRGAAGAVTNSGLVQGYEGPAVQLADGGSIYNASAGIIEARYAVYVGGAVGTVTNAGLIEGEGAFGVGVDLLSGGYVTNALDGTISGGTDGVAFGDYGSVDNAGTILGGDNAVSLSAGGSVSNASGAVIQAYNGIYIAGAAGTVTNSGLVQGSSADDGTAIWLADGGSISNGATGVIKAFYAVYINGAAGAVANAGLMEGGRYVVSLEDGGTIGNAGTITASGNAAVYLDETGTVSNNGLIDGDEYVVELDDGGTVGNSGTISASGNEAVYLEEIGTVSNSGLIAGNSGVVYMEDGGAVGNSGTIAAGSDEAVYLEEAGTVSNSGLITGDSYEVYLEDGGVVDNIGTVSGGEIAVYLAEAGTVANSGVIAGDTNIVDLAYLGVLDNTGTVSASSGDAVFVQSAGTVVNAGTIAATSDAVDFASAGLLVVDPGAVFSGNVVGDGGMLQLAPAVAAVGTLTGLGSSITGFSSVAVDAGAAWVVAGGAIASGVTLTDLGTLTDTGVLTNAGTLIVGAGGALVVDPATLVNSGYVSGTVTLAGASYLDNTATGTIVAAGTAVYGSGGTNTVANSGTVVATGAGGIGIILGAGGAVTNAASAVVAGYHNGVYIEGSAGTIANFGTIVMTGSLGLGAARLEAGGTIANFGTIIGGAALERYAGSAADLITNGGGGAAGALITGPVDGIDAYFTAPTTVVNAATIVGVTGDGINLLAGGAIINSAGIIAGNAAGVKIANSAGTVINQAAITASGFGPGIALYAGGIVTNAPGGSISGGAVGVLLQSAGATVVNDGTIAGGSGTAVAFGSAGGDELVVGSNSVLSGAVADISAGDVIDFAAFAFSAGNTASYNAGTLTVSGGGLTTSLTLADVASGSVFNVTSDGHGGTDVTLIPVSSTAWANSAGGDWNSAANWTSGVPGSGTDATIGVAGGYTVILDDESGQANLLTIDNPSATLALSDSASLSITSGLTNSGLLNVDGNLFDSGGSTLTISGTLTNDGTLDIGNSYMSAPVVVSAAGLTGSGTIDIIGSGATLDIAGALSNSGLLSVDGNLFDSGGSTLTVSGTLTNDGTLNIGNATISAPVVVSAAGLIGSGTIDIIGSGATLDIASALSPIAGGATLRLADGAAFTDPGALTNSGLLNVDGNLFDSGGSTLTVSGTLTNDDTLDIGNSYMSAPVVVSAAGLTGSGTIDIIGSGATLDIAGALSNSGLLSVDGNLFDSGGSTLTVSGTLTNDGTLNIGNATISAPVVVSAAGLIGSGTIDIIGSGATLDIASALSPIAGGATLRLADGAAFTDPGALTNSGLLNVDGNLFDSGGSTLTISGTLTNDGTLDIGNSYMSAPVVVSAAGLTGSGTIDIIGSGATLDIAGALSNSGLLSVDGNLFDSGGSTLTVSGTLTNDGTLNIGNATISAPVVVSAAGLIGSGTIDIIGSGATLDIASALSPIAGGATLRLADGAAFTDPGALTNSGLLNVDGNLFDSGGSTLTISGTLTNDGTLDIGNSYMSAPVVVSAAGLTGSGTIDIDGGAATATLAIASGGAVAGNFKLLDNAALSAPGLVVESGGSITVGTGGSTTGVAVGGGGSETVSDGGVASGVTIAGGLVTLEVGAVMSGAIDFASDASGELQVVGTSGTVLFPSSAPPASVTIISGFALGDTIDLASLPFLSVTGVSPPVSGVLDIGVGAGQTDELDFDPTQNFIGAFTLASDGSSGTLIGLSQSSPPGATFGSTNSGIVLNNTAQNPATITAVAYVTNTTTAHSGDAVYGTSSYIWTVSNYGTLNATQSNSDGILLGAGGIVTNASSGTITGYRGGVIIDGAAGIVANYGTIITAATLGAQAINLHDGGTIINHGAIANSDRVNAPAGTGGIAIGLESGLLVNEAGATINGGIDVALLAGYGGGGAPGGFVTVSNFGTIENASTRYTALYFGAGGVVTNAAGALISSSDTGVAFKDSLGTAVSIGTVINFGTIAQTGTGTSGVAVYLGAGGTITNQTGGLITGHGNGVSIDGAAGTVGNLGTIDSTGTVAAIRLADGGLIVNGTIGSPDTEILAAAAGNAINIANIAGTLVNYGTVGISGTGNALYLAGGAVLNRNVIESDGAGGIVAKGTVATTITNFGTIASGAGGTGGEAVYLGTGGLVTNDGLISGAHPGTPIVGTSGGYPGVVQADNTPATVANLGTITNPNNGNGVNLLQGGLLVNGTAGVTTAMITAPHTGIYMGGRDNTPYPGAFGTVVNYGTIAGTSLTTAGSAVVFTWGGTVVNRDLIDSANDDGVNFKAQGTAAGTIVNFGTIATEASGTSGEAIYLGTGGIITNYGLIQGVHPGAPVSGTSGGYPGVVNAENAPATVVNFGTIASTTDSNGVNLLRGGLLVNGSAGAASALITAYHRAVYMGGKLGVAYPGAVGTIVNYGTIAATGVSSATTNAAVQFTAGGSLVNAGLIEIFATAHAAIYSEAGGIVTNAAGGTIASPWIGIHFGDTSGTTVSIGDVVNQGTIESTGATVGEGVLFGQGGTLSNASGGLVEGYIGIAASAGGSTIVNAGTISGVGGTAVSLSGSDNRIVVDPGAVFAGDISGGGASASNDIVELAAGSGPGTILNNGLDLHDFGGTGDELVIDAGAVWTVSASGSFPLPTTVDAGSATLAGTITNNGTIDIETGAMLGLTSGLAGSGSIDFAGNGGLLLVGGTAMPTNTLSGFTPGDTIDLQGVAGGSAGSATRGAGNLLTISEGGQSYQLQFDPAQSFTSELFLLTADGSGGTDLQMFSGSVVGSGQTLVVSAGQTIIDVVVESGGVLEVQSGATVSGAIIEGGASEVVGSGAADFSATIENGGVQQVYGTASGALLIAGGSQTIEADGSGFGSVEDDNALQTVSSGGLASGTIVSAGDQQIVLSGGVAIATTVDSGGSEIVSAGGTASRATISGGVIDLQGNAIFTVVMSGGVLDIAAGGTANATAVSAGGTETVGAGGTDIEATVESGGLQEVYGTANGVVTVAGGSQSVEPGGLTSNTLLDGGAVQTVSGGGAARATTIGAGDRQLVLSGGAAIATVVTSGGSEIVAAGGTLSGAQIVADGLVSLLAGAAANGTINFVGSGGELQIDAMTAAFSAPIEGFASGDLLDLRALSFTSTVSAAYNATSGVLGVTSGGVLIEQFTLLGITAGTQFVVGNDGSDFTAVSVSPPPFPTTVSSGQTLTVSPGQTVSNITVEAGGTLDVASGGIISGARIDAGGTENVSLGGLDVGATVESGGVQNVYGSASGTRIIAGGSQTVEPGGSAADTLLDSAALQTVSNGGTASGTVVSAGDEQVVLSGGVAIATTVSSGGSEVVASGGTANGVTIDGGLVDLHNGALLSGGVTFVGPAGTLEFNAAAVPSTVPIAGFSVGDTISLANVVATAVNYQSGAVILSNAGEDVATLAVSTPYGNPEFSEVRDTTGGTEINVSPSTAGDFTYITDFTKTNVIQTALIKEFATGIVTGNAGLTVPFDVAPDASGDNFSEISNSLTIDVSIPDVTNVFTLLNAYYPSPGLEAASVEFIGSEGATQTFTLADGSQLRDFYQGEYANTINGTTTQNFFTIQNVQDGAGTGNVTTGDFGTYNIDEQDFALNPAFATQNLTQIIITNLAPGSVTPILLGLTTESTAPVAPPPSQLYDFVYAYNTGGDDYQGTVVDNGTYGYQVGTTVATATGEYTIFADAGAAPAGAAPGTVTVSNYVYDESGQVAATLARDAVGSAGLGSENGGEVLGNDGSDQPFSVAAPAAYIFNSLYTFVFTYADGRASYAGTVASAADAAPTIPDSPLGGYTVSADGATTETAGTVTVDEFTLNGISVIPGDTAVGKTDGSDGLGSEADTVSVDGQNLAFSDQTEPTVSGDVFTAEINEIYADVLGRAPDPSGLATYTQLLENGETAASIRTAVSTSQEAQNDLNALYLQVLGRDADPGGAATYTNYIDNGASLADVQLILAESPEAQNDIGSIYQQVLGRNADPGGLVTYMGALADGMSLATIRGLIGHSAEVQTDLDTIDQQALDRAPTAAELVADMGLLSSASSGVTLATILFQSVIGRAPDAAELAGMEGEVVAGSSLSSLQSALATSGSAGGYSTVTAAAGSTTLTAPAAQPTQFDFGDVAFGNDTISGFAASSDAVQLSASLAASFAAIQADMTSSQGGTLITFSGSQSIFIAGVTPTSLNAANFLLTPTPG